MAFFKIFFLVAQISLMSFGGVYSFWAQFKRVAVIRCDEKIQQNNNPPLHWCENDFNFVVGISEFFPGPKISAVGLLFFKDFGPWGLVAAVTGVLLPFVVLIPFAVKLHLVAARSSFYREVFRGIELSVLALLVYLILALGQPLLTQDIYAAVVTLLLIASVFFVSYRYRVPPFITIPVSAVIGYLFL